MYVRMVIIKETEETRRLKLKAWATQWAQGEPGLYNTPLSHKHKRNVKNDRR